MTIAAVQRARQGNSYKAPKTIRYGLLNPITSLCDNQGAPFTATVDFAALDRARFILNRTHAFVDANEADAAGIRLILPAPEIHADAEQH
jgi:hypothetical protein